MKASKKGGGRRAYVLCNCRGCQDTAETKRGIKRATARVERRTAKIALNKGE